MNEILQIKFEAGFVKGEADDCWEWTMSKGKKERYGRVWFEGRKHKAHRIAYQLYIGEIPEGMCVCHHCDNPSCVNPKHLFLGTRKDNMKDCANKGRIRCPRGEHHPRAKLTAADVVEIRTSTVSSRTLAPEYGITSAAIRNIRRGIVWKKEEQHGKD